MAQRRAQSADRAGQDPGLGRLADLLSQLVNRPQQPPQPRETFKAPTFDGSSDVECFIRQFQDVSLANGWTDGAALLHIRTKLKEEAKGCGQGEDLQAVFTALRARFGMTRREARTCLAGLKRNSKTTLYAHAAEVDRLVQLAYAELPDQHRSDMSVELFCSTLGHPQLQRHLLAIPLPDLQAAVRAGNDYLQIQPSHMTDVKVVAPPDDSTDSVKQITPDPLQQLMRAVQDLTLEVSKLKGRQSGEPRRQPTKPGTSPCHNCGQDGHWRRDCPQRTTSTTSRPNQLGNG